MAMSRGNARRVSANTAAQSTYDGSSSGDAQRDALLRLVLDTSQDAFVAMDEAGIIRDWNPAAELLFGWPREEAVGRPLGDTIVPERLRAAHRAGLERYLRGAASAILGRRLELPAVRRDGSELLVELTISPLRVGDAWLFAAFARDATGRALSRAALERDHSRLVEAQRAARLGSWELDLVGERLTASTELYAIVGMPPGTALTGPSARALVHRDDLARVEEHAQAALRGGAPFDLEFRIVRSDGQERTVHGRAVALRDETGRAARVIGTHLDVTERVQADAQTRRLAAVVASTTDAVMTEDRERKIMSWNAGAERLYGLAGTEALGRHSHELVPPELAGEEVILASRVLAGERVEAHETRRLRRDGTVVDVSLTVSPVHDADGRIVEVSTIARDITARKRAEREVRRYAEDLDALARRDPLTGLLTQRELHGVLDAELGRAGRSGARCSLVLLDVDGLAAVNAEHGRDAGDAALRSLAEVVLRCCDSDMTACRLGGDELAIVAPGRSAGQAMALANRIVAAWRATDPLAGVTSGVASFPGEARDGAELLAAARAALDWAAGGEVSGSHPTVVQAVAESGHADTADRVVALLRRHLGMEIAYLSEFVGETQVVRTVDAGPEHPAIGRGDEVPLSRGYCRRMVEAEIPGVIPDTAAHPVTAELEVTRAAGIGSYVGVPVRRGDGRLYGSLCAASRDASHVLDETAAHFAHVCARLIGDLLDQRELEDENRRLHGELTGVRALLAALDARDNYTGAHSEAVVELAGAVARRLRLDREQVAQVEQVALLHDIGKIGVPDAILQKPGPLDDEEWRAMREHPAIGSRIVTAIGSLAHLAPAVRAEHERWDGGGYPDHLAGDGIPLASRVILACDAFHAMTSDRPYRRAMPHEAAVDELRDKAGRQFDPTVVDALLAELADPRQAPAAAEEEPRRPTVLVVEDDPGLRLALEHGLMSEGFDVEGVADAASAYRRAVTARPDVILLDWVLAGGESGPGVCRRLRAGHPTAPVLMHSGLTDPRDRRAALDAGAHAFVEKGASVTELAAMLRAAIDGAEWS